MDDYPGMVRKVWPDYTGSENSISATSAAKSVGVQQLYMYLRIPAAVFKLTLIQEEETDSLC